MRSIDISCLIGRALCEFDGDSHTFHMITGVNEAIDGKALEIAKSYSDYPAYVLFDEVKGLSDKKDKEFKYELPSAELVRRLLKR